MEKTLETIKCNLEKEIKRCAGFSIGERSVHYGNDLIHYWTSVNQACEDLKMGSPHMTKHLTEEDAMEWNSHMVNQDGTTGPHWSTEETNELARALGVEFTHISPWCWNVCCNMMYSDYFNVAMEFNTNTPSWYGQLARDFLFDPDGLPPKTKLCSYFRNLVKPAWK